MPITQVIILAIVQGLTEFLPISSTAHLFLASSLLGWKDEGLSFDISLHIGTLLAVIVYFFGDWVRIVAQGFGMGSARGDSRLKYNHMLLWLLVIGTIPVGIAGLAFHDRAEGAWRNHLVIGFMMIAVGILMWIAEDTGRQQRDLASVGLPDALAIGIAQALAVVPGTSRSGITITCGLFRSLTRESAARFSFLLSTPAIAAAAAKDLYEIHQKSGLGTLLTTNYLVGIAVSGITGCIVIAWFLRYLRHAGLRPFVYYRIIFGIIILALAFIRRPA